MIKAKDVVTRISCTLIKDFEDPDDPAKFAEAFEHFEVEAEQVVEHLLLFIQVGVL
jgi:hypothetical protein